MSGTGLRLSPEGGRMRTCSNCGSEIGSGDVFCGNCGTGQAPLGAQGGHEYGSRSSAAGGFADPATTATGTSLDVATLGAPPGQGHRTQPPNSVVPPSGPIAPGIAPGIAQNRANETVEQKYLRQTRNATVFIAVIVGIATVITVIGVIWSVVNISKLNSQLNGGNLYSTCQSQGGTNPSC